MKSFEDDHDCFESNLVFDLKQVMLLLYSLYRIIAE